MNAESIKSLNIPINAEALKKLGFEGQETVKTTFTLSTICDQNIRQLANDYNMSIRECLDKLADIAEQADKEGYLITTSPKDGKRVSYAISKTAKETFESLAEKRKVSRDEIVESVYFTLSIRTLKESLTTHDKIHYAKKIDDALTKMREIYYSEDVEEAIKQLSNCGDEDLNKNIQFGNNLEDTWGTLGGYLIDAIYIADFIKKKEEDLKNEEVKFLDTIIELVKNSTKGKKIDEIIEAVISSAKDKANENNTTRE